MKYFKFVIFLRVSESRRKKDISEPESGHLKNFLEHFKLPEHSGSRYL